uniref:putative disease resistance RPP13-like protein 1 n=1 Tax=Erigeron canadensis TaxID=72917 RepID=UPI001CB99A29|nr:putative disease resistance RPP13-like protein 1 [Erigeron canadensis]
MAEVLVGAAVTVLVEKLFSSALMNFAQSQGIDSQLKKLKITLPMIQAVLADAAQKQITQKAVKLWLIELQDLAYDIDDVLDDLTTESMKRKLNQEVFQTTSSGNSSKLLKILPTCCTNFTPHNMMYGRKISSKLDNIISKMHDIIEQKHNLGLKVNVKSDRSNKIDDVRFHQTSLIDESKVLGREGDKEVLLENLLRTEEESSKPNVSSSSSIVSIVGMGGIGKTTLARLLYNDQKVKDHFEIRAWVCVSDEFDVLNISKAIYQALGGEDKPFATLDLLHLAIKEIVLMKRFLVVLDDVWNEDHKKWDLLKSVFDVGVRGSKIMVTTRKKKVALVMDSPQPYKLEVLKDEIALSLFAQSALVEKNFDKHQSLEFIARGIVKKCDGLPLALVTLGRVLKTKENDDEWVELLNSEVWNLQDESDILPSLKLSYYDLPSHLKQLFAYCSIFPKDHEFEKNELVLLWMAQGFLSKTKGNKSMESLGRRYFEELQSRSFFQPSVNRESRYMMHDLIHDLAISVAGEFFFFLDLLDDKMNVNGQNRSFEKLRHFSFINQITTDAKYRKFKEVYRARCLRTFLPLLVGCWWELSRLDDVLVYLLPQLKLLRVLSLTSYSITKVPQSIGSLRHLRYLNFSGSKIKHLPEQVSELYNLQTLFVCWCDELSSLPGSFLKLINLRHLDMTGTPLLKKLPLGIGGLTSLQTLSKVIIEDGNGFNISDLKGLRDLQGQLSIQGLDNVIDPLQADNANLQQKKGLDNLELKWSVSENHNIQYEVLERLRPHSKLKKLDILYYGGMKFPNWIGDPSFDRLSHLGLHKCKNCRELPTLGQLTSLTELSLCSCDMLESYNCPNSVESLVIICCHSMTSLTFSNTQKEIPSSCIRILKVIGCKSLTSISHVGLQSLTSLEELEIRNCPSMEDSFPCGLWPPNLRRLVIGELNKPMSEWGIQNYPNSLHVLWLFGKNSGVVSFGVEEDHATNTNNSSTRFLLPASLISLEILDFIEVESLSEVLQHFPFLEKLSIQNCPKLRDVPETTSSLTVSVLTY